MSRRWYAPLATLALVTGSLLAAGSAAAATPAPHAAGVQHAAQPGGIMIRAGGGARARVSGARASTATSTNWSGYASDGSHGQYTSVSGAWTEPSGTCAKGNQYSSFWVGLDGYSSDSVEQTGTDVDCSGRTPVYYGWYEMFPAFPVNFSNPVHPGDHFTASVTFSGTSTFTLSLTDATQGWTQTETQNQSGLDRSSAECIVEAPSSGSVLPLADFGTVSFSSCQSNGSAIGSQSPIQITMVNNKGVAKDSVSTLTGGTSFTASWLRKK
ncbi:MAG TPA: G1 family glutamic endopeptidase [Streptosporangiaceae bacterium]|jgi:hypothetical protein